jgi:hypothetical protein
MIKRERSCGLLRERPLQSLGQRLTLRQPLDERLRWATLGDGGRQVRAFRPRLSQLGLVLRAIPRLVLGR